jgi:RimJ/RimL family protein N-acetyltransferase
VKLLPCELPLDDGEWLVIDRARSADARALIRLAAQVAGESDFLRAGPSERAHNATSHAAFLERLARKRRGFVLKASLGPNLVGTLSLVRPDLPRLHHRAELGISVSAAHWSRGIGRRLMATAIVLARQQGVRKLNLRVRNDNHRAIRLYRSFGFVSEGTSTRALLINGRFFSERHMGLCLDPVVRRA